MTLLLLVTGARLTAAGMGFAANLFTAKPDAGAAVGRVAMVDLVFGTDFLEAAVVTGAATRFVLTLIDDTLGFLLLARTVETEPEPEEAGEGAEVAGEPESSGNAFCNNMVAANSTLPKAVSMACKQGP